MRIWYKDEEAAFKERLAVGMTEKEADRASLYDRIPGKKHGIFNQRKTVNPLRGLRGDAKDLWERVRSGEERRMQLQQYGSFMELQGLLEKCRPMVVIWCGGYGWNGVPFVSERGDPIDIADGKGHS